MYQIEHDIPVPAKPKNKRGPTYPFDRMEVGDSFLVPVDARPFEEAARQTKANVASAATRYAKNHDESFRHRTLIRHDEGGVRVWRIA